MVHFENGSMNLDEIFRECCYGMTQNHPDKAAFDQYDQQWKSWEAQVLQRRQEIRESSKHQNTNTNSAQQQQQQTRSRSSGFDQQLAQLPTVNLTAPMPAQQQGGYQSYGGGGAYNGYGGQQHMMNNTATVAPYSAGMTPGDAGSNPGWTYPAGNPANLPAPGAMMPPMPDMMQMMMQMCNTMMTGSDVAAAAGPGIPMQPASMYGIGMTGTPAAAPMMSGTTSHASAGPMYQQPVNLPRDFQPPPPPPPEPEKSYYDHRGRREEYGSAPAPPPSAHGRQQKESQPPPPSYPAPHVAAIQQSMNMSGRAPTTPEAPTAGPIVMSAPFVRNTAPAPTMVPNTRNGQSKARPRGGGAGRHSDNPIPAPTEPPKSLFSVDLGDRFEPSFDRGRDSDSREPPLGEQDTGVKRRNDFGEFDNFDKEDDEEGGGDSFLQRWNKRSRATVDSDFGHDDVSRKSARTEPSREPWAQRDVPHIRRPSAVFEPPRNSGVVVNARKTRLLDDFVDEQRAQEREFYMDDTDGDRPRREPRFNRDAAYDEGGKRGGGGFGPPPSLRGGRGPPTQTEPRNNDVRRRILDPSAMAAFQLRGETRHRGGPPRSNHDAPPVFEGGRSMPPATGPRCYVCDEAGHIAKYCPSQNEHKEQCGYCRDRGHEEKNCAELRRCENCKMMGHQSTGCTNPIITSWMRPTTFCNSCGQRGHMAFGCPFLEKNVACSNCKGLGHASSQCRFTLAPVGHRQQRPDGVDSDKYGQVEQRPESGIYNLRRVDNRPERVNKDNGVERLNTSGDYRANAPVKYESGGQNERGASTGEPTEVQGNLKAKRTERPPIEEKSGFFTPKKEASSLNEVHSPSKSKVLPKIVRGFGSAPTTNVSPNTRTTKPIASNEVSSSEQKIQRPVMLASEDKKLLEELIQKKKLALQSTQKNALEELKNKMKIAMEKQAAEKAKKQAEERQAKQEDDDVQQLIDLAKETAGTN